MKRYSFLLILWAFIVVTCSSCAAIVYGTLMPNQCQTCKVVDEWGNVVWSDTQSSGSLFVGSMEKNCEAEAYRKNSSEYYNRYRCSCTWEKKP